MNNPSFEDTLSCPNNYNQVDKCKFWFHHKFCGSPEYFNSCCSNTIASTPFNAAGFQNPRTGNAYTGIATYYLGFSLREYIENGLVQKLDSNKIYCVTLYANLSEASRFISNNIGVLFSPDTIKNTASNSNLPLPFIPSYENSTVISDTINWVQIQGQYLANGKERFITIGNFRNDAGTTLSQTKPLVAIDNAAYYYIDDVSLIEIKVANSHLFDTVNICPNDSVVLGTDSTEFATYAWSSTAAGLAALSCTNCPNPIAKPLVTTKYYLTKQQCSATTKDSVTVVVLIPTTQANAGIDKTICLGDVVQIGTSDSLAFTNYTWQNATTLSCSNCALPFANPNVTTTYTVQRTECANITTDTVKIIIDDCDPTFVLPNVFTPNGDEVNDTWGINFSTVNSHITNFKMSIYDRWGLLVYSTNPEASTPNSKWDGRTTAGIECNAGVYFYVITFSKNEEEQKLTGHLSLFR